MTGPTKAKSLGLDEQVDLKKLKFYYIRQSGELRCSVVSSELQAVMTKWALTQWTYLYSIQTKNVFYFAEQLTILRS